MGGRNKKLHLHHAGIGDVIGDRNKKLHLQHAGIDDVTGECIAGHSTVCICASCTSSKHSQKPTSGLDACEEISSNQSPQGMDAGESEKLTCPLGLKGRSRSHENAGGDSVKNQPSRDSNKDTVQGDGKVAIVVKGSGVDHNLPPRSEGCADQPPGEQSRASNISYVFFVSKSSFNGQD